MFNNCLERVVFECWEGKNLLVMVSFTQSVSTNNSNKNHDHLATNGGTYTVGERGILLQLW